MVTPEEHMQDSNFHLVDSRPTRSKNFGQRRHQFQHNKRTGDKDDYRTLNPKAEQQRNQRNPPHQKRPHQFWREQRVCSCRVAAPPAFELILTRCPPAPVST